MTQAQAQAQKQRQHTIAHTESLELVRCLLRVVRNEAGHARGHVGAVPQAPHVFVQAVPPQSIFHISYLRGLFPDEHFKGVDMPNLDGMNIKMLLPNCSESRRLIDWVEEGVYDAVARSYLKGLFFGIATDPDGLSLLEEYIFKFNYCSEDGRVTMDVQQRLGRSGARASLMQTYSTADSGAKAGSGSRSVEAVKYQVLRLMRMLVQICQTLDRVPHERYLFMKLTYHPHTPADYEPPYFAAADERGGVGHFSRKPFAMEVGQVSTHHHTVALHVKSTLDCCGEEDRCMAEDELQDAEPEGLISGLDGGTPVRSPGLDGEQPAPPVSAAEYEAVKVYVTRCLEGAPHVLKADVAAVFVDITAAALDAMLSKMQAEGVVLPHTHLPGTFQAGPGLRNYQAGREGAAAIDALARQVEGTALGEAAAPAQMRMDDTPSLAVATAGEPQAPAAHASGVGDHGSKPRARKTSYVSDPIHQSASKRIRSTALTPGKTGSKKPGSRVRGIL